MSEPEKCFYCGSPRLSGRMNTRKGWLIGFTCGLCVIEGETTPYYGSRPEKCKDRQIAQLKAVIRDLILLPKILSNEDSKRFDEILNRPQVKAVMGVDDPEYVEVFEIYDRLKSGLERSKP